MLFAGCAAPALAWSLQGLKLTSRTSAQAAKATRDGGDKFLVQRTCVSALWLCLLHACSRSFLVFLRDLFQSKALESLAFGL